MTEPDAPWRCRADGGTFFLRSSSYLSIWMLQMNTEVVRVTSVQGSVHEFNRPAFRDSVLST